MIRLHLQLVHDIRYGTSDLATRFFDLRETLAGAVGSLLDF